MNRHIGSRMSLHPEVILSIANIRHYYYAALALQQAGYLKRFICSVAYDNDWYIRYLPDSWKNRLSRRNYSGIEASSIITIPWAELLARGLNEIGLISSEQSNWLFSEAYDWVGKGYIDSCDFFHFVVPSGLHSAIKAKEQGGLIIADVRTANPDFNINQIKQENELWGFHIQYNDLLHNNSKAEFQLADYIIVPSEFAKNTFVQAGFDERKIFCIPYGVDHTKFSRLHTPNNYSKENLFRILYVGRLSPLKGIHYLIQAFGELDLPDSELLLVGPIEDSYYDLIQSAVKKDKRIRAIGSVPQGELIRYFQKTSVFVLPTLSEGSAMVVYEAMAAGIPVITTPNAGSIVEDGLSGFIVPIRDPDAIKMKLLWLYDHPEVRKEMGKSAYRQSCGFTWDAYGQRLLFVYSQLMSK